MLGAQTHSTIIRIHFQLLWPGHLTRSFVLYSTCRLVAFINVAKTLKLVMAGTSNAATKAFTTEAYKEPTRQDMAPQPYAGQGKGPMFVMWEGAQNEKWLNCRTIRVIVDSTKVWIATRHEKGLPHKTPFYTLCLW